MGVEKILEYQSLDSELFKIEKQLRENKNKKLANEMHENMKNAQTRSLKLEEKAGGLIAEIDKVKKHFKIQEEKMNEFLSKDLEKLSKEEVDKLTILSEKLAQNLVILDKNLTALAESVNVVLSDFNKTIKEFNASKEQFTICKEEYDNEVKTVEKEKNNLILKLKDLSKNIDSKIMEAYIKRRKENIFPVLVPLKGNSCGGCHMELPYATISVLNNDGILTCEHCHRIIYKK